MIRWPIREALELYYPIARERALVQFRHDCLMWAVMAPYAKEAADPPEVPEILQP